MERWMDIQKLGQLLRWMGAVLLVVASASFMLEGWEAYGSQLRYFLFLGYVLGLAGLGILLGWRVQEDKGARTLLGLAIVGIAAQFSQLGAMIHSLVSVENGALPRSLLFEVESWAPIAVNTAALLVLIPVAYLGFSALNRPQAHRLTVVYLIACSSLLIPVRHGVMLTTVIMGVILLALWLDARFIAGTTNGGTAEGIVSRVLPLLPVGILMARSAFYPQSALFLGLTAILVGLLCFEMLPKFVKDDAVRTRLQALTCAPILIGWFILTFQYLPTVFRATPPIFTWLPLSVLFAALSVRACGGAPIYRKAAALLAALAWAEQLTTQPTLLTSVLCLAFSIGLVLAGFLYQERVLFVTGLVGALFALAYHVHFAMELYAYNPWGLLAAMGIVTLLTASYLEKHAAHLFGRLVLLREELKGWH
jgi:hypothetical protein